MASGFQNEDISSMDNFDVSNCNIQLETRTSNFTKQNWDDETDKIRDHFRTKLHVNNPPFWTEQLPPLPENKFLSARPYTGAEERKWRTRHRNQVELESEDCFDDYGDDVDFEASTMENDGQNKLPADGPRCQANCGRDDNWDVMISCANDAYHNPSAFWHLRCLGLEETPEAADTDTWLCPECTQKQKAHDQRAKERQLLAGMRNMSNLGATCYMSSAVQMFRHVPTLRGLVLDPEKFALKDAPQYQGFARALIDLFCELGEAASQLPRQSTQNFLTAVRVLDDEWKNEQNDSADFWDAMTRALFTLSTTSTYDPMQPALTMLAERDGEEGFPRGVRLDAVQYWLACARDGHETPLAPILSTQIASERSCKNPVCGNLTRSWQFTPCIPLSLPHDAHPTAVFSITELLDVFMEVSSPIASETDCPHCGGLMSSRCRRIISLPEVLVFRLKRFVGNTETEGRVVLNRVEMDEIDMNRYVDDDGTALPSERVDERYLTGLETKYKLVAVNNFVHSMNHYVSYVRVPGGFWVRFDDMAAHPTAMHPRDGVEKGEAVRIALYVKEKTVNAEDETVRQAEEEAHKARIEKEREAWRETIEKDKQTKKSEAAKKAKEAREAEENQRHTTLGSLMDEDDGVAMNVDNGSEVITGENLAHSRPTSLVVPAEKRHQATEGTDLRILSLIHENLGEEGQYALQTRQDVELLHADVRAMQAIAKDIPAMRTDIGGLQSRMESVQSGIRDLLSRPPQPTGAPQSESAAHYDRSNENATLQAQGLLRQAYNCISDVRRTTQDFTTNMEEHDEELERQTESHAEQRKRGAEDHANALKQQADAYAAQRKREAESHVKNLQQQAEDYSERIRSQVEVLKREANDYATSTRSEAVSYADRLRQEAQDYVMSLKEGVQEQTQDAEIAALQAKMKEAKDRASRKQAERERQEAEERKQMEESEKQLKNLQSRPKGGGN